MATRIVNLDLAAPLPNRVSLDGRERLWMVGWKWGRPVGATLVVPRNGADGAIERPWLLRAVQKLGTGNGAASRGSGAGELTRSRAERGPGGPLPRLSVVICTRDRPDRLPIVLDALSAQTHPNFELIIVDNAPSDDRTRRVVLGRWPDARYTIEPEAGAVHARDRGARMAEGDVVAYTDDDCRPVPEWLARIAREFAHDPELGCVTGPILPLELETPAQEALEARGGFNRGFERRRYVYGEDDASHLIHAWRFGAGGNFALARDLLLDDLHGFDEALPRSEDLDILYRAVRSGRPLLFEPGVAVHHRHPTDWSTFRGRMFGWGRGYLEFLDKIARTDSPEYARYAAREKRDWLGYQLRERLMPSLGGAPGLPLSCVAAEIAGGLAGWRSYRPRRTRTRA